MFEVGSVIARVKADITDFKEGMKEVKSNVDGVKSHLSGMGESIADFGRKAAILTTVVGAGVGVFLKQSSEEANNFAKAMTTLDIIAGRFGQSGSKAQMIAKDLGKELRIGTSAAAESIQNLLKSGLNLDQASNLIKRFTNEAITGKSANISLAQAVQNLSFAYNTQNSALGNMSGVSENFEDIIKKGRESLIKKGVALNKVTDDMAKYEGMINLTNLTLGSSERFTGTLVDKQAQLDQKLTELKITIGTALNPVLATMIDLFVNSGLIEGIQKFVGEIPKFVKYLEPLGKWVAENQELVVTFLKGLAVGLGALLIIGTITALLTALLNPLTLVALAIAALYTAWQTNFWGIRDVLMAVINEVISFFNNILMPAIQAFSVWWAANWKTNRAILEGVMKVIIGIIQVAWGIIYAIFSVGLALITGDWATGWENIKHALEIAWQGVKNIFSGIVQYITGWGGSVISALVRPFEDAWNRIRDLMNKIKDAVDFTKRHSPSVVDIVNRGVNAVNKAMEGLDLGVNMTGTVRPALSMSGGSMPGVTNVHIDMNGAIIADSIGAQRMAEMIGDGIVRRVNNQVKI